MSNARFHVQIQDTDYGLHETENYRHAVYIVANIDFPCGRYGRTPIAPARPARATHTSAPPDPLAVEGKAKGPHHT